MSEISDSTELQPNTILWPVLDQNVILWPVMDQEENMKLNLLSRTYRDAGLVLEEHEDGLILSIKGAVVARFGSHATIAALEKAAHQIMCEGQNGVGT